MGQPLHRLMYVMNCGVRCGCGIPFPKCFSTLNGLLLWFSKEGFLKQKTSCCSPDNDFLLRMTLPGLSRAQRGPIQSVFCYFSNPSFPGSQLTSATPSAWKVLPPNNQIGHFPSLHSGSAQISFPLNSFFPLTFCPFCPGLFFLREITTI